MSIVLRDGERPAVPRRILVVGGGGREHALAQRLAREDGVEAIFAAPGNPGIAEMATIHADVAATDLDGIVRLARAIGVDLVVVGPEVPLVAGLADRLTAAGIPTFGPHAGAAAVEGSKAHCRAVAEAAGIPMARGAAFELMASAVAFADRLGGWVVVKADGLAAGKGVTVCDSLVEAEEAIRDALERGAFGDAGRRVVVEERLEGPEASLIAICDATTALALPAARDHKRIGDGDTGPNTGGMGAYSPLQDLGEDQARDLVARIHRPALRALARAGTPFRGALFAGLILTADGPRLLEFNARFGDPEAQVLLPRIAVPLAPLLLAAATDRLAEAARALGVEDLIPTTPGASVGIVLAAAGYPARPRVGDAISGIAAARDGGADVFHAGTALGRDGAVVTAGGRVLTVVGHGATVDQAAARAYEAVDRIDFDGRQLRRDIGRRPVTSAAGSPALAVAGGVA